MRNHRQITLVVDLDFGVFDRWFPHVDLSIEIDPSRLAHCYRWSLVCNTVMMASMMTMVQPFGLFAVYQNDMVTMLFAVADDGVSVADSDSCAVGCDREFDLFYYRHWLNEI